MKKELRAWLILIAWVLIGTSPVIYAATTQNSAEEVGNEPTEDIIRWKEDFEAELEVTVKPLEQYEPQYYDVPLSKELQLHIFKECEKHNIAPAVIIAMIERESDFDERAIGDNGNSFGLMQIQPKWHKATMDRLGCTNLLVPFQNVTVGIDYVAELKEKNNDLYWVLMAYNAGPDNATEWFNNGIYSDYAIEIVERASELEDEYEKEKELYEWKN